MPIRRLLLTDLEEEVEEVDNQLDQMGYNIRIRLIDEFLAKSNIEVTWLCDVLRGDEVYVLQVKLPSKFQKNTHFSETLNRFDLFIDNRIALGVKYLAHHLFAISIQNIRSCSLIKRYLHPILPGRF
ncbi:hypothetical protein ACOSQ3_031026 [Xanthoceras sorbifolium]